jgi:hypothetical protein
VQSELDPSHPECLLFHAFHGSEITDAQKVLAAATLLTTCTEPEKINMEMVLSNNGYRFVEDAIEAFLDEAATELKVSRDALMAHCKAYPRQVRFSKNWKTPVRRAWKRLGKMYHQFEVRFRPVKRPDPAYQTFLTRLRGEVRKVCSVPT